MTRPGAAYDVVHGWPRLPDGETLGFAVGVAVDSRERVFVFHRGDRRWTDPFPTDPIATPTIAVFDARSGEILAQWGAGRFVMPHGLAIDRRDHLWVTDVALHQVFELTPEGELLRAFGERGVPGADATHFALPTDVAVLPDGGFWVSDGYGNARLVRFASDGRFVSQVGSPGAGPGEFDLPHAVALDDEGRVYVCDRGNSRVQVFDPAGGFLAAWKSDALGRPYGIGFGRDGKAYVVDGGDQPSAPPDRSRALRLDRAGRIEATFGRYGNQDGQFMLAHAIAAGGDGAVYVADTDGRRAQKFLPRSQGSDR